MNVKVEIPGLDKLLAAVKKAPAVTLNEVSKAVQKSALTVQSAAIKEAPVNKGHGGGNLRQNIKVTQMTKTRAVITSRAPYSIFVEEGTKPHLIRPKVKKALADRRNKLFFGKLVHHPGTKANPFMERAVKQSQSKVTEFFKLAMVNVIKTLKI
jgi:HK97 gp10 family phage protein